MYWFSQQNRLSLTRYPICTFTITTVLAVLRRGYQFDCSILVATTIRKTTDCNTKHFSSACNLGNVQCGDGEVCVDAPGGTVCQCRRPTLTSQVGIGTAQGSFCVREYLNITFALQGSSRCTIVSGDDVNSMSSRLRCSNGCLNPSVFPCAPACGLVGALPGVGQGTSQGIGDYGARGLTTPSGIVTLHSM